MASQFGANNDNRSVFEGHVDGFDSKRIVGWAFKAGKPPINVLVEAVTSSGVVVQSLANIFRQDLKDLGYGSGKYGFDIERPKSTEQDVSIVVRFFETKMQISGGSILLDPKAALLNGMPSIYSDLMQQYMGQARMAFERISGK